MSFINFFPYRKKATANIAKERLRIIVAERRGNNNKSHYLSKCMPQLKNDLIKVICKYVHIDPEMLSIQVEKVDGDISVLELNITLSKSKKNK